jgi:hypothetical protein
MLIRILILFLNVFLVQLQGDFLNFGMTEV